MLLIWAVVGGLATIGALAVGRWALLGWYLWEVRQREVPQDAKDQIRTYPLA